jgi:hypothetical protein
MNGVNKYTEPRLVKGKEPKNIPKGSIFNSIILRYTTVILIFLIICNRFEKSKNVAAFEYSAISDSIKNQLTKAYYQDTAMKKQPLLTWLNLNGEQNLGFRLLFPLPK